MAWLSKRSGSRVTRADGSRFVLPTRLSPEQEIDVQNRIDEIGADMPEWATAFERFLDDGRNSVTAELGIERTLGAPPALHNG